MRVFHPSHKKLEELPTHVLVFDSLKDARTYAIDMFEKHGKELLYMHLLYVTQEELVKTVHAREVQPSLNCFIFTGLSAPITKVTKLDFDEILLDQFENRILWAQGQKKVKKLGKASFNEVVRQRTGQRIGRQK